MIKAQCPPRITLPGLDHHISIMQGRFKSFFTVSPPFFCIPVHHPHVGQITFSNLTLLFPGISLFHQSGNSGSISGKTTYVLAGENMGPAKLEKARKLGIEILSEDDFLKMIGKY